MSNQFKGELHHSPGTPPPREIPAVLTVPEGTQTRPKIKLDWRKLESGSAPLPDETVVFGRCVPNSNFKKNTWVGSFAHYYLAAKADMISNITHWSPLPEFEPPEDAK